jgi:hypothetical protein
MHFETRPRYSALRARYERSIDTLVVLAAVATLPIVVAEARGDTDFWVLASDWLIWSVFVLDYLFMVLTVEDRLAYRSRRFLTAADCCGSEPATQIGSLADVPDAVSAFHDS